MKTFLFSVDVEGAFPDDTSAVKNRVFELTKIYLDFLKSHGARATFFIVGKTAEAVPGLVRAIVDGGHEIACHSHVHKPLDKHTLESFRADLLANIAALKTSGAQDIRGYRAPILSMSEKTLWAYDVMRELGITYSSSVLPAQNPLYGWPGHPQEPTHYDGILEIPVTLNPNSFPKWPIASGVYLRLLPKLYIMRALRDISPLVTYIHPYDLDTKEKYRPRMRDKLHETIAMYYNRRSVLPKLETIMRSGYTIEPYRDFIENHV